MKWCWFRLQFPHKLKCSTKFQCEINNKHSCLYLKNITDNRLKGRRNIQSWNDFPHTLDAHRAKLFWHQSSKKTYVQLCLLSNWFVFLRWIFATLSHPYSLIWLHYSQYLLSKFWMSRWSAFDLLCAHHKSKIYS